MQRSGDNNPGRGESEWDGQSDSRWHRFEPAQCHEL